LTYLGMADSPVPGVPGLRTPEREQSHAHWADSPALPAWRPDLQHWLQPVEAWQASEDGLSWCALREDPGEESLGDLEEEIDRFLNGLQAVQSASVSARSAASVFTSKSGSEVCSQEDMTLRSVRSDRCFSSASATALKVADDLLEEVPDEPMQRCSHCGRSFWARRLQVHESICKGTRQEARRVFESQQQRLRAFQRRRSQQFQLEIRLHHRLKNLRPSSRRLENFQVQKQKLHFLTAVDSRHQ